MHERDGPQQRILSILSEEMNLPVPSAKTDLFDEGILDSLAFVDLLARLEAAFDVEIAVEDLDLERLRTVRAIADLMLEATQGAGTDDPQIA